MKLEFKGESRAIESIFNIWSDGCEGFLVQTIWPALIYSDTDGNISELEYHRRLIMLLAFRELYGEFCKVAFKEPHYREIDMWAGELEFNPYRICQLYGMAFAETLEAGEDETEDLSEDDAYEKMLELLVMKERGKIPEVLIEKIGRDRLFTAMFISPSRYPQSYFDDDEAEIITGTSSLEEYSERIDKEMHEILNSPTSNSMAGYSWLLNGMQE